MNEDFHKKLMAAVQERLRLIKGNEEKLIEAWVAQHGFKPDECEIVRQDMQNGTVRMWVAKRGEFEELQRFRARERLVQFLIDAAERTDDGFGGWPLSDLVEALRDFGPCISGASADASSADDLTSGGAVESTKPLEKVSTER